LDMRAIASKERVNPIPACMPLIISVLHRL
jgi:hypothetical protein